MARVIAAQDIFIEIIISCSSTLISLRPSPIFSSLKNKPTPIASPVPSIYQLSPVTSASRKVNYTHIRLTRIKPNPDRTYDMRKQTGFDRNTIIRRNKPLNERFIVIKDEIASMDEILIIDEIVNIIVDVSCSGAPTRRQRSAVDR